MFYPNHQCRSYCLYLGSCVFQNQQLDMGVYEDPQGYISHAIVYGPEDWEYYSGNISFDEKYNFKSIQYKINKLLYENYLEENRR